MGEKETDSASFWTTRTLQSSPVSKQMPTNCVRVMRGRGVGWRSKVEERQVGCAGVGRGRGRGRGFAPWVAQNILFSTGGLQELCQSKDTSHHSSSIADSTLTAEQKPVNCAEIDEEKYNLFPRYNLDRVTDEIWRSRVPLSSSSNGVNPATSNRTRYQLPFDSVASNSSDSEDDDDDEPLKTLTEACDYVKTENYISETERITQVFQELCINTNFKPRGDLTYNSEPKTSYNDSEKRIEDNSQTNLSGKPNAAINLSRHSIEAHNGDNGPGSNALQIFKRDRQQPKFDLECYKGTMFPEFSIRPSSNKEYFMLFKSLVSKMRLEVNYEVVPHLTSNSLTQCLVHISMDPKIVCHGSAKSETKAKYSAARSAFEFLRSMYGKG